MEIAVSPNERIELPILKDRGIELWVKREDLLHPLISGNKYRKLKYNLEYAEKLKKERLITFGGAFSNHILATAAAGMAFGFKTLGIIRGEELGVDLEKTLEGNSTLNQAVALGMELQFVTREEYQQKNEESYIDALHDEYPNSYLLPEGGTNFLAVQGCEEILTKEDTSFSHVAVCMGTGGTATGIINSSSKDQKVMIFPAVKGDGVTKELEKLKPNKKNWEMVTDFHFRGYAKYDEELITFINEFKTKTKLPLDPIYTGKMMYGLMEMIVQNRFEVGSKILAIHTGGLQGIDGVNRVLKQKNKATIQ